MNWLVDISLLVLFSVAFGVVILIAKHASKDNIKCPHCGKNAMRYTPFNAYCPYCDKTFTV